MSSSFRFRLPVIVSVVLIAPRVRGDEAPAKPLTVCALPTALPRTGKAADGTPRGLDVALAERLGRQLGRPIEYHWCANAGCAWNCLPAGRCDVVLGQPLDSGPARGVAWSVPYAGARFGLVVPREARDIRSLADLQGRRVGIVAGTVAVAEKDHTVIRFPSREAALDQFRARMLDAAFLDADFAAWYLHEHEHDKDGLGLRLVADYVPRERWNMALAVRSDDGPLLLAINRALAQLAESGEIRKIYEEAGVPFHAPFTFNDADADAHAGASRPPDAPDTWRRVVERGELVVSMDPANLPYSAARGDRPGFDVEIARALAAKLGVKLRLDWIDVQRETALGELLQHRCDLVLGEAIDANAVADDEPVAGKVAYSRPYYGTGYVLVHRKNGPMVRSLAELKGASAQRLGAEAGSIADYRLRQRGHLRRLYRNQLATLRALHERDIDHAYLWANVGWTLHASPDFHDLEIVPGYVPEDHWNIAAALIPGDDALKRQVDAALGALLADGTIARTLARYHVPTFDPFPEPGHDHKQDHGSIHENAGPIRHEVADRGREPELRRVQRSKSPYSGLARVRSAGVLVVGLDPNNLPFSTAHPEPKGLDYEIAGLLADALGVSLRVFWGVSSHDSYPSQLATRRHCDVILGVMPDDRFAQRVLYSRPYYYASYRWAVRSGSGTAAPPGEGDGRPVAVEEGVAVRGLKGRAVHGYPSTDAVLEAIIQGRETTGYVITTRGPWRAEQRWPGALLFLGAGASVDRFPICAALRREDGDLKDALDRAWAALDRSGRLAPVFARWHVPYDHDPNDAPYAEPEMRAKSCP